MLQSVSRVVLIMITMGLVTSSAAFATVSQESDAGPHPSQPLAKPSPTPGYDIPKPRCFIESSCILQNSACSLQPQSPYLFQANARLRVQDSNICIAYNGLAARFVSERVEYATSLTHRREAHPDRQKEEEQSALKECDTLLGSILASNQMCQ